MPGEAPGPRLVGTIAVCQRAADARLSALQDFGIAANSGYARELTRHVGHDAESRWGQQVHGLVHLHESARVQSVDQRAILRHAGIG